MAERPTLSPSCPRDEVIPPLKSNFPEGAYSRTCPEPSTSNWCASPPPWSLITRRPGILVAEFHKSPCSQPGETPSGMVKTTVAETLFWVSARRPSSSWRLARVQGQWGWTKSTRVSLSETSRTAEPGGKSVIGIETSTGVNSSWAKNRNPTTRSEPQRTPAAARKPSARLLLLTALIRLRLPLFWPDVRSFRVKSKTQPRMPVSNYCYIGKILQLYSGNARKQDCVVA
jgi:hypothetical protein